MFFFNHLYFIYFPLYVNQMRFIQFDTYNDKSMLLKWFITNFEISCLQCKPRELVGTQFFCGFFTLKKSALFATEMKSTKFEYSPFWFRNRIIHIFSSSKEVFNVISLMPFHHLTWFNSVFNIIWNSLTMANHYESVHLIL